MKKTRLLITAALMSAAISSSAYAGVWQQDTTGWWWQNDDGTYPANCWQWIDGNGDGVSEYYYFNENGYCLMNTTTPDGNTVNASGAWTVNGIVQTQIAAPVLPTTLPTKQTTQANTTTGISTTPYDGYTIIVNTNTGKYHNPSCRAVSDMNAANMGYCSDASYLDAQGYSACKLCH